MKKSVLILCQNKNDSVWAVEQYNSEHNNTLVLTPSLEAQLYLKENHIPYLKLFEFDNFEPKISELNKKNVYSFAKSCYSAIRENSKKLNLTINGHNLFTVSYENLLFIYADIIHSFGIYKKIVSRFRPDEIFLPAGIEENYVKGDVLDYFSLAYYIKYYFHLPRINIKIYKSVKEKNYSLYLSVLNQSPILIKNILLRLFYIALRKLKFNRRDNVCKSPTILMQTGGLITAYYYKLYPFLIKNFNFKLITYKLNLQQQISLIKHNVAFTSINSLWCAQYNSKMESITKKLINKINLLKDLNAKDYPFNDVSLKKALLRQTIIFFKQNVEAVTKKILLNEQLLKQYQPKLVINSHDPSISASTLILPAKSLNIPTLLLLHGITLEHRYYETYSDHIAAWGVITKNYFEKNNRNKGKNIFAGGFPKMDEYDFNSLSNHINHVKKSNHILTIGFLLTSYHPFDSFQSKFFHELFEALGDVTTPISCSFRFHEGFHINNLSKIASHYEIQARDKSSDNLITFLKSNEVILSWDTTAILWSMLFKKPLFYTCPVWGEGLLPVKQYKAAWIPNNAQELINKIKEYAKNPRIYKQLLPGQKRFLEDYAGPLDGKSTERLYKLIKKLANKKTSLN